MLKVAGVQGPQGPGGEQGQRPAGGPRGTKPPGRKRIFVNFEAFGELSLVHKMYWWPYCRKGQHHDQSHDEDNNFLITPNFV